jgi:polar amino acid transport system substrate-binding protein
MLRAPKNLIRYYFLFVLGVAFLIPAKILFAGEAWDRVERTGEIRWGGDLAGGAPYVYPDPDHPEKNIGFEVEIMEALAAKLGVRARFVSVPWDQLVPALLRDDFDMVLNGLEITQNRRESIDFTVPYYIFSEIITVPAGDTRIHKFEDLRGRRVGTLSASLAQNILEKDGRVTVVSYPTPVEAIRDLDIGRIDATLLDLPIANFYVRPSMKNLGELVGEGLYAGGIRKDSPVLRAKADRALEELLKSGELDRIYRKWQLWTDKQLRLREISGGQTGKIREKISIGKYWPMILKGAGMTLVLSVCAMALAVLAGFLLSLGKLYGSGPVKFFCHAYIELIRGTPLLIQLYLLYYGLPNIGIQLNAFVAALLGLGLNYAAYEAEIYRAGFLSISKGQDEAARSLGMTGWQSLRYVIVPQAVRTILPPSTNDFIALFKDTSLVSIITVTELTRAYSQAATTTYRFLELGLLTAFLYFLMSFPLSLWSRSMEKSQNALMY